MNTNESNLLYIEVIEMIFRSMKEGLQDSLKEEAYVNVVVKEYNKILLLTQLMLRQLINLSTMTLTTTPNH